MEKILVDTDVIIDFLRGFEEHAKSIITAIQRKRVKGWISLVSITELYAGNDTVDDRKRESLEQLLPLFSIAPPDLSIAKHAGILKRQYSLALADAYIAATCIEENFSLATFNTKHFRNIRHLKLYNSQSQKYE